MKICNETSLRPAWIVAAVDPARLSATWIVKGTFRLLSGGAAAPLDNGEFPCGDVPLKYEGDFAPFKPRTDVLVVGTCHVPGRKPTLVCPVSVRLGRWEKTIAVVGDRYWRRGIVGVTMSQPVPFTSMPIVYG